MNAPDRNKVRDVFLTTLREFLGENAPAEITEATDPFKDLGLDSEDGVEFACVLSEKFGCIRVAPPMPTREETSRKICDDLAARGLARDDAHFAFVLQAMEDMNQGTADLDDELPISPVASRSLQMRRLG